MQNENVTVNILYYIEKKQLVLHCPQFALFGVSDMPKNFDNENDVIIKAFKTKLKNRIARFKSPEAFFSNLVSHGIWNDESSSNPRPLSLEYYIKTLPYLQDTMNQPGAKNIALEYNIASA